MPLALLLSLALFTTTTLAQGNQFKVRTLMTALEGVTGLKVEEEVEEKKDKK